ncbi:hypothetical protein H6G64_27615 [Calothrix sp. FACHB-156]|nr:hypothetical protein [Calothrix sp. FACHB-156]
MLDLCHLHQATLASYFQLNYFRDKRERRAIAHIHSITQSAIAQINPITKSDRTHSLHYPKCDRLNLSSHYGVCQQGIFCWRKLAVRCAEGWRL